MNNVIENINKYTHGNNYKTIKFNNDKLIMEVFCYTSFCYDKLFEFSDVFNSLFNHNADCNNILLTHIIEDEKLFNMADYCLHNDNLVQTIGLEKFNKATHSTSLAKCTFDENYYIMKCYDYYIYIFNKKNKECYMLIKKNKKAITMINILILTPYIMYGELYAVHGGLVHKDNQNILISNSSLGGKTTFALLFASNGWDIITEETTYITKDGNIMPYNIRNYFNIRAGTYLAFEDYFFKKGIINKEFLKMKGKSNIELFKYGKENQFSIDFDKIGVTKKLTNIKITHSLKVSINMQYDFELIKNSPIDNVTSFLELSLAPTVLLFQELFKFYEINKEERKTELNNVFKKTKSYILNSGFDYRKKFNKIIEKINKNTKNS